MDCLARGFSRRRLSMFLCLCLLFGSPLLGQVVINEVYSNTNPGDEQQVELKNIGSATADLSGWWLCNFPDYLQLGQGLTIPPGGIVVLHLENAGVSTATDWFLSSPFPIGATDGEFGLYISQSFGSSAAMRAYMQYGSGGHTRATVAVAAGLWGDATDFVPTVAPGHSMEFFGSGTGPFSSTNYQDQTVPTLGNENTSCGLTITGDPDDVTACLGGNVTFTVDVFGVQPITFQWRQDGDNIIGATASTLTLNSIGAGAGGSYDCVVTGPCLTETSQPATLTIDDPVSITTQPQDVLTCVGSPATFQVAATGTAPITFQWRLNGDDLPGENQATLNIASVEAGDVGTYDCVITNSCGSVPSNPVELAFDDSVTISAQTTSAERCAGESITFSVTTDGPNPTFQWFRDNDPLAGQTSNELIINSVTLQDAGTYHCEVSNTCASVESNDMVLDVIPAEFGNDILPFWNGTSCDFNGSGVMDILDLVSLIELP